MSENNMIPPMVVKMQIIDIQLEQKAPSMMGMFTDKTKDIFHVFCVPISLIKGHKMGWEKLREHHLEEHADQIAGEYATHLDTFKATIPMTRNTIEMNDYSPGEIFELTVKGMNEEVIVT